MMTFYISGVRPPSRTKEKDEYALWKKTDPIWLLRQCLGNKLRSQHWRAAHHAKKKWLDAVETCATTSGEPVSPPVLLIVRHGLTHCPDVDAPVKVVLDAIQETMITTHDDRDISTLIVLKKNIGKKDNPYVYVEAVSMLDDDALFRAQIALDEARR
tara:strand:- start:64 stop:534 length:471 start_codon:yes stop_codon:yes gene_type:complete